MLARIGRRVRSARRVGATLAAIRTFGTCLLVTSVAWAQGGDVESRVLARRMADGGANLYESGKYEEAREMFHRANSLYPALEFWEARALNKLGRLVEAEERFASVKRYRIRPEDSDVVRVSVAEAGIEVENLRKRIPTITIQLHGANPNDPSVAVQLSGKPLNPALLGLPIPADPSIQTIRLIFKGIEICKEVVVLKEGDRKTLALDATAPNSTVAQDAGEARPSVASAATTAPVAYTGDDVSGNTARPWYARRDVGWAITGFGAASLAVGVATGIIAVGKHDALVDDCPNNACKPAYEGELSSYHSYRTISTIGYVVGAIGLGTGITILLTSSKSSDVKLALQVNPSSTALGVHF